MPISRYAITDRSIYGQSEGIRQAALLKQVQQLAEMGIDFIQLREKDLSAKELIGLTCRLLEVLRRVESVSGEKTRLLVNSRADIAAAAGANGVHLTSGREELTPAQARLVLGVARESTASERAVVSVSCHNLADVERARRDGADLILFGPVFGKSVHGNLVISGTGVDALREACIAAGSVPVFALGGVAAENTAECLAAGAGGVAGIRMFQ